MDMWPISRVVGSAVANRPDAPSHADPLSTPLAPRCLLRHTAFLSHSCSLVRGLVHCFLEVAPMFPTITTSSVLVLAWH